MNVSLNPTARRLFKLSEEGCAFATDPNPGAFPLLVIDQARAVLMINGEPAIFAADSGSPMLTAGIREKYVGRTHWAQISEAPDMLTLRDRYERIVYQAAGKLTCRG
ncbi:MAG: hypothetical protein JF595_14500 [Sphingomonadales bacterium]|nr:hypothetical protein [Sphingomonadales bacterium]